MAERICRGPMSREETVKLGRDIREKVQHLVNQVRERILGIVDRQNYTERLFGTRHRMHTPRLNDGTVSVPFYR